MPNRNPERFGLGVIVAQYEDHVLTKVSDDHYVLIGRGLCPSPLWLVSFLPLCGDGWFSDPATTTLADMTIQHLRFEGAPRELRLARRPHPASKIAG